MDNKEVLSEGIYIVTEKIASSEDDATFKIITRSILLKRKAKK